MTERFVTLTAAQVHYQDMKSLSELSGLFRASGFHHAIAALRREAEANLVEDHFHPEIAGPLQLACEFLEAVRGNAK